MTPPLGIIEGFFGPVWSWQERSQLLRTVAAGGFTQYVYAPKGDRALRRDWALPYGEDWLSELSAFAKLCASLNVEFGVGISPYGLQNDVSGSSLSAFRTQLTSLTSAGVQRIAILFDDMEVETESLADSQLRIVDAAVAASPTAKLSVCPSYYSDDIVLDRVFGERPADYLATLGKALDSQIEVFWTGPEVCARQLDRSHLERITELLRRKPTIWDNYPVNDGPRMSNFLHLRAITGRRAANGDRVAAHMLNPALQATLTAIPALTLAQVYAKGDQYDYAQAFIDAAETVAGPALALALREDLLAFQETGRHQLDERLAALETKYRAFDHPAAREVLSWLRGDYAVSREQVLTQ